MVGIEKKLSKLKPAERVSKVVIKLEDDTKIKDRSKSISSKVQHSKTTSKIKTIVEKSIE